MSPKSVIVFYSWVGSTKIVADEIQKLTGFDVLRIEEKKERQLGKIMGAATSAFFGFKSGLKSFDYALQNYDLIYLGTPVWAGKTPPAMNKFLSKANLKGKRVRIFITKADEKVPQKVFDSITARIERRGGTVVDCLPLTTKWDPKTNVPIASEEISNPVQAWI